MKKLQGVYFHAGVAKNINFHGFLQFCDIIIPLFCPVILSCHVFVLFCVERSCFLVTLHMVMQGKPCTCRRSSLQTCSFELPLKERVGLFCRAVLQTHLQYRTGKLNLQLQASLTTMVYGKVQLVSCLSNGILLGYFLKGSSDEFDVKIWRNQSYL